MCVHGRSLLLVHVGRMCHGWGPVDMHFYVWCLTKSTGLVWLRIIVLQPKGHHSGTPEHITGLALFACLLASLCLALLCCCLLARLLACLLPCLLTCLLAASCFRRYMCFENNISTKSNMLFWPYKILGLTLSPPGCFEIVVFLRTSAKCQLYARILIPTISRSCRIAICDST